MEKLGRLLRVEVISNRDFLGMSYCLGSGGTFFETTRSVSIFF